MKTVIEMAREATLLDGRDDWSSVPDEYREAINAFAELVRADEREQGQRWFDAVTAQHKQAILAEREAVKAGRNATLDEIAKKIEAMPFGDTAASFAVWIKEQKT